MCVAEVAEEEAGIVLDAGVEALGADYVSVDCGCSAWRRAFVRV